MAPPLLIFLAAVAWFLLGRQRMAHLERQLAASGDAVLIQLQADREYYSSVVVPRLIERGHVVEAPYGAHPGSFPLPATFVREVTERINRDALRYEVYLVSPWPINKQKGIQDAFQQDGFRAIEAGSAVYQRRETIGGREVMRLMAPDKAVHPDCVSCHNAHPDSPRRDFQLGEVMGGLEVRIPMDASLRAVRRDQLLLVGGGAAISLLITALVFWGSRRVVARPVNELTAEMERISQAKGVVKEAPSLPRLAERGVGEEIGRMWQKFWDMHLALQAHQAEVLKRQREGQAAFLAGVAHDIRNVLGALKTALTLATRQSAPSLGAGPADKTVALFKRQVDNLERMVTDMLDAARLEAGHLDLRMEERDLRGLASEVVELFRAAGPRHVLVISLPEEPVRVRCDPLRIEQVVNNLLSNAIKYSPSGQEVRVVVSEAAGEAAISVSDRGPGLNAEQQRLVFNPFERAGAERQAIPGSGLGLWVSKGIVEAHHGRLEVESRQGEGSTFRMVLPRARAPS